MCFTEKQEIVSSPIPTASNTTSSPRFTERLRSWRSTRLVFNSSIRSGLSLLIKFSKNKHLTLITSTLCPKRGWRGSIRVEESLSPSFTLNPGTLCPKRRYISKGMTVFDSLGLSFLVRSVFSRGAYYLVPARRNGGKIKENRRD